MPGLGKDKAWKGKAGIDLDCSRRLADSLSLDGTVSSLASHMGCRGDDASFPFFCSVCPLGEHVYYRTRIRIDYRGQPA